MHVARSPGREEGGDSRRAEPGKGSRTKQKVQNLGPWRKHAVNKNSIPKNSDPYIDISCAAQSCFEPATLSVLCWTYIVTKLSFQLMEWGFGFVFLPKRSSFPFSNVRRSDAARAAAQVVVKANRQGVRVIEFSVQD